MSASPRDALDRRGRLTFICIGVLLIGCALPLFPFGRITDDQHEANPQNCTYYVSLQSLLANYPLLAGDKANAGYIAGRLRKFENDLERPSTLPKVVAGYKAEYLGLLKTANLTTMTKTTDEALIMRMARKAYRLIDRYYLDDRLFCLSPFYQFDIYSRYQILPHNLSGLYDGIPPHSTILADSIVGPSSGLLFNNQTMTFDTRFVTGMPLLTALYAVPKSEFSNSGDSGSSRPMKYFQADSFADPTIRKALDVAGIDIFMLKKREMNTAVIPGTRVLASDIPEAFSYGGGFVSLINTQSYGMAYLARRIDYVDVPQVRRYENEIRHYFQTHNDPREFQAVTDALHWQLSTLKNTHDVLLEAERPEHSPPATAMDKDDGFVEIEGMTSERALFVTHCPKENCTLVFNRADVPGWRAFVNGTPSEIHRVNFAFMSVTVPHGDAGVWFVYESLAHLVGDFISLLSLIGIIMIAWRRSSMA